MSARLTFFCELETKELQALFHEFPVMDDLAALEASVSMGILDLSPERADVVRRLNRADIPVVAWLLLPQEEGYWFNFNNAEQAVERYKAFKNWTDENELEWWGLGIDIEPDFSEMASLMQGRKSVIFPVLRRFLDLRAMREATATYWKLVSQMQADGYHVDIYHFPFIVDERKAGSTLIQRLVGLVDVPTDREVFMLYTSMLRPRGPGILWSYAPEADSVGVGSTGGGVQMEGIIDIPPLDWVELSRDLRLARRWKEDIHIFSLEGCIRQGFMGRLKNFDWDGPVTIPLNAARGVDVVRKGLRGVLWASAHPLLVLLGIFFSKRLFSRLLRRSR
jgi:hypothetical protein